MSRVDLRGNVAAEEVAWFLNVRFDREGRTNRRGALVVLARLESNFQASGCAHCERAAEFVRSRNVERN